MNRDEHPETFFKVLSAVTFWVISGLFFITCGWPFTLVFTFFAIVQGNKLAEKKMLEAHVHKCPGCNRELGKTTRICPRCGHRFKTVG